MNEQPDATTLRFQIEVARENEGNAWEIVSELCDLLGMFVRINEFMLYRHDRGELPLPTVFVTDLRMACHFAKIGMGRRAEQIKSEREAKPDGS